MVGKRKETLTYIFIYIAFLIPVLFMNCSLRSVDVLDETSNLSITAYLAGYNWSYTNFAIGNYFYKYFQVLFYLPFFKMNIDPFLRYQLMMGFNSIIYCFVPVICYHICRSYLKLDYKRSVMCSFATGSIASVILYTQHVSSDLFMEVLPWVTILFIFKSMRSVEENRKIRTVIYSICTAFVSVCAYASHGRGIIIVIASFMTIVLMRLVWKKKIVNFLAYIATLIICLVIDSFLTRFFMENVFPFGVDHNSLSNIETDAMLGIFTSYSGFVSLVKLFLAWLYSAATSSFGMCLIGLVAASIILHRFHKNKEDADSNELVLVYMGALVFLGAFSSGILFFYPDANRIFIDPTTGGANRLFYDRYMACGFGLLFLIAFLILIRHKEWLTTRIRLSCIFAQSVILLLYTVYVAPWTGASSTAIRHTVTLSRFINILFPGKQYAVYPDAPYALPLMGIYSVLVLCLLFLVYRFGKKAVFLMLILTVINIENTVFGFLHVRYDRDVRVTASNKVVYEAMSPLLDIDSEYKTLFFYSPDSMMQMQVLFPDFTCIGYDQRKELPKKNVIYVISKKKPGKKIAKLLKKRKCYLVSEVKWKNNMVFITGKNFAKHLRNKGVRLVNYSQQNFERSSQFSSEDTDDQEEEDIQN